MNSPNQVQIKLADSDIAHRVGESTIVIVQSLRGRRADILDVGESTLDVGKQTVGETTRRRNDRNIIPSCHDCQMNKLEITERHIYRFESEKK